MFRRGKPYLIGEIGINHNGDLQIVKKLIDACFACGWDCVKFQKRNPDICVPKRQKNKIKETPWGTMTYLEYKKKMEFGKKEYDYIDKYCKTKPIDWTASVWDLDSLDFINQYDVPFIKIPSAMIINDELLIESARTGKRIIISTGMSTFQEIDKAVNILLKEKSYPIILHCNSSYPTPKNEINLKVISSYKSIFGKKAIIGYSGHEENVEASVLSVVLGAEVIERHITMSHDMWGTDQKASLEIVGMYLLKKRIDEIEKVMGNGIKEITKSEIPIRKKLRG